MKGEKPGGCDAGKLGRGKWEAEGESREGKMRGYEAGKMGRWVDKFINIEIRLTY